MPAGTGGLEIVCSIAAKGQQFIILCPVQLVDIQTKGRRGREVKLPFTQMREHDLGKVREVESPISQLFISELFSPPPVCHS